MRRASGPIEAYEPTMKQGARNGPKGPDEAVS